MKLIVLLMGAGFFAVAYELFVEVYVSTAHEPNPLLCLVYIGAFGLVCMIVGYVKGSQNARSDPEKEDSSKG